MWDFALKTRCEWNLSPKLHRGFCNLLKVQSLSVIVLYRWLKVSNMILLALLTKKIVTNEKYSFKELNHSE